MDKNAHLWYVDRLCTSCAFVQIPRNACTSAEMCYGYDNIWLFSTGLFANLHTTV